MGYKVYGIQDPPSFHPHCEKTFSQKELSSILPAADVVCLTLSNKRPEIPSFGANELRLLKEGVILLLFGNGERLSLQDLEAFALSGKARGIAIDAHFSRPLPSNS